MYFNTGDDLRLRRTDRRLFTNKRPSGRVDARLPKRIEGWCSLDPRIAIPIRNAHGLLLMGVTAMHARFQVAIALAYLIRRKGAPAQPKVSLRSTACEDDVSKFLHFLTKGRVGTITDTRGAVGFTSRDGDEDVFLRPRTFSVGFP